MTLYLIGLGLNDEKDISIKGLETVRRSMYVYLETYTSNLQVTKEDLERFYGKDIVAADREMVELRLEEEILSKARDYEVSLLVIGDPFGATTHTDIRLRAWKMGIPVKVIHNASVLTAVGLTGLELYKFGKTTSIPFENSNVTAPIDVFRKNRENGLHTLFLLDLSPKDGRFMSAKEACEYLLSKGVDSETLAVSCAGLGKDTPEIRSARISDIPDMKAFPQCLIIPGELHFIEEEALELWK